MRLARILVVSIALLVGAAASAQAAFPGVNGRIAFDRTLPSGQDQIFSVAADGSTPTNLSNAPAVNDQSAAYSGDGKLIAITRATASGSAIWVMNADGSNQHQISVPGSGESDVLPAFSPDGKQIVFERDSSVGTNPPELLFVVNIDGGGQHQLVTPPLGFFDETPTWSPDGTKIAFMREPVDDSGGQIMRVNANGTGTATPASHPPSGYKDGDPNFSPDGSKIVFSRSQAVELDVASNIVVADLNTGAEAALTNDTASTFENEDPAFSPDGKLIAYARADNSNPSNQFKQLYVMAANGSGKHAITPPAASQFDGVPNWQPLLPTLTGLRVSPAKVSTAGRRVNRKCVKQTKNNKHRKQCRRSVQLTVSYTLNGSQDIAFIVTRSLPGRKVNGKCVMQTKTNRKHKGCTLTKVIRRSTASGAAGANRFTFDAKTLGPASYVLTATPSAAGLKGAPRSAGLKILS